MKVTKVDGISHKKYIEEGKLVKSTSEENRIRRENLKEFFSNKVLYLKDGILYLKDRKEKNQLQNKNYSEEDISEYDLKNKNNFLDKVAKRSVCYWKKSRNVKKIWSFTLLVVQSPI